MSTEIKLESDLENKSSFTHKELTELLPKIVDAGFAVEVSTAEQCLKLTKTVRSVKRTYHVWKAGKYFGFSLHVGADVSSVILCEKMPKFTNTGFVFEGRSNFFIAGTEASSE